MRPEISAIPEKEQIETPKRQYLTPKEEAELMLKLGGKCGCGCGRKLEKGNYIKEHTIALAAGGKSKPDSLFHIDCATPKTKEDQRLIAKLKRLRGETGKRKPGAKIAKIPSLTKEQRRAKYLREKAAKQNWKEQMERTE